MQDIGLGARKMADYAIILILQSANPTSNNIHYHDWDLVTRHEGTRSTKS